MGSLIRVFTTLFWTVEKSNQHDQSWIGAVIRCSSFCFIRMWKTMCFFIVIYNHLSSCCVMQIEAGLYANMEGTASNQQLYFIALNRWWRPQFSMRKQFNCPCWRTCPPGIEGGLCYTDIFPFLFITVARHY